MNLATSPTSLLQLLSTGPLFPSLPLLPIGGAVAVAAERFPVARVVAAAVYQGAAVVSLYVLGRSAALAPPASSGEDFTAEASCGPARPSPRRDAAAAAGGIAAAAVGPLADQPTAADARALHSSGSAKLIQYVSPAVTMRRTGPSSITSPSTKAGRVRTKPLPLSSDT
jgi:hypothetical protein